MPKNANVICEGSLKEISTLDFSKPDPSTMNNPIVQKFIVEKSGVEKFMVEESGIESSGV